MPPRNGGDLIQCKLALSNHNNMRETKSNPPNVHRLRINPISLYKFCSKMPTSAFNQDVYEGDACKIEILKDDSS